jgi:hypothetical protein
MNKTKKILFCLIAVVFAVAEGLVLNAGAKAQPKVSDSGIAVSLRDKSIIYENKQYGFLFTLPETWKGYTIVTNQWEGYDANSQGQNIIATGPIILIRHPLWTAATPRQDIPIMVFTIDQWDRLQRDEFHIGAAPINPSELGRNSKYVFALPARYNFAFLPGWEEVQKILDSKPLTPIEPANMATRGPTK